MNLGFSLVSALFVLTGCAKTITRSEAESLLSSFLQVTSETSYVKPTGWTSTTTYDCPTKTGASSVAYDAVNHYFHSKQNIVENDGLSSKTVASELFIYVLEGVYYYVDAGQGIHRQTSEQALEAFASDVTELYDPSMVLDDALTATPSQALLKLSGFDTDASSCTQESYSTDGSDSLSMTTTVNLFSAFQKKETLNFRQSRFYERITIKGTDKISEIYAWDQVTLSYPEAKAS